MDPLSLTASITAVLQLTRTIIGYLKDVHDSSKDRTSFLMEVSALTSLLSVLQGRARNTSSSDPWLAEVQKLRGKDSALDQLESALERLKSKLEAGNGFKKVGKMLSWTFDKTEIKDLFDKIERLKTLIGVALAEDHFALSRAIKADVSEITVGVSRMEANQRNQEHRAIATWVSPLDFKEKQDDILKKRESGTGRWLLKSQTFKDWLAEPSSEPLWCSGIPGAGKTVLASIVFDYLRTVIRNSDDRVAAVSMFCDYKEQANQTVFNLLASLLKQLIQDCDVIPSDVESLYKRHTQQNSRPTVDEITKILQSEIRRYSRVFIVVDALDECPEDNGTRAALLTTLRALPGTVSLMVTSRDLPVIAQYFQGSKHLDIRASHQDVRKYVEGRIAREPRLASHVRKHPTLRKDIVDSVMEKVDGMFLLARLHLDSLASKTNAKAVREALVSLPRGVDNTYEEAMRRIEGQIEDDKNLAIRVLFWTTYAHRPLLLEELQYALAVSPEMTSMDMEGIEDEEILTSVCAGLVVIDQNRHVRFVHYSTQEYFERTREYRFPNAQAHIAVTCLTYLSFDVFVKGHCRNSSELASLLEDNVLLDYAAGHWGHHARGQTEEKCKGLVMRFLQDDAEVACATQVLLRNQGYELGRGNFSGLHVCSLFGLERTAKDQIEIGARPDLKDAMGRTPLSLAAEYGHEAVVKLLVERDDVDVNSKDDNVLTPLVHASHRGHKEVVDLLLRRDDLDVNAKDETQGWTPLFYASHRRHKEVVDLLLRRDDLDVNTKDKDSWTPLFYASHRGDKEVVDLLLRRDDLDVNAKDKDGQTPLFYASHHGHKEVVDLLLRRDDLDVNL